MMRVILFLTALSCTTAFEITSSKAAPKIKVRPLGDLNLRQWVTNGQCFNLALVPQYNNQHSIWGLLEHMRRDGMLMHMTGISACSGGTLPGAFLAAGKDFSAFSNAFPENGWLGFGPSEPKISEDYTRFLAAGLPETFEELKIPFAISATVWDTEKGLKYFLKEQSHPVVLTRGKLYPAMLTAVATANSGIIPDHDCPRCKTGFWPQKIQLEDTGEELYPVTDGAFTDIWGTKGLLALPRCNRLLHILPLDYPGQTAPQPSHKIPNKPTDLVTLVVTQPPTGSHSYFLEGSRKIGHGLIPYITKRTTSEWNHLMYSNAFEQLEDSHTRNMEVEKDGKDGLGRHHVVLVDTNKPLRKVESFREKLYDAFMNKLRDNFWKYWDSQGSAPSAPSQPAPGEAETKTGRHPIVTGQRFRQLGAPVEWDSVSDPENMADKKVSMQQEEGSNQAELTDHTEKDMDELRHMLDETVQGAAI